MKLFGSTENHSACNYHQLELKMMNHQRGKYIKTDILDLSSECPDGDFNCDTWLTSAVNGESKEHRSMISTRGVHRTVAAPMSEKEMRIRHELEMTIEKDLEQEIKDGISHLALRLNRLYQQRRERKAKEATDQASGNYQNGQKLRAVCEVNISISISMEGGTRIEFHERKKFGRKAGSTKSAEHEREATPAHAKFDWVKTLRSNGAGPVVARNKN